MANERVYYGYIPQVVDMPEADKARANIGKKDKTSGTGIAGVVENDMGWSETGGFSPWRFVDLLLQRRAGSRWTHKHDSRWTHKHDRRCRNLDAKDKLIFEERELSRIAIAERDKTIVRERVAVQRACDLLTAKDKRIAELERYEKLFIYLSSPKGTGLGRE